MTKILTKGETVTINRPDSGAHEMTGVITEVERTTFASRTPQSIKVSLLWPGSTKVRSYRFSSTDLLAH